MTRPIIGTALVVLAMVLTAWVALNEPTRIATYDAQFNGRSIETGARDYELYCSNCHGPNGEGVPTKGPELYPNLFTKREPQLKAIKAVVTLSDFVKLTIAGGRPISSTEYANGGFVERMNTWSDRYGGPLRDDQIQDITNFIMNWREQASLPKPTPAAEAAESVYPPSKPLPAGDPARGQKLLSGEVKATISGGRLPCFACHTIPGIADATNTVGPTLAGIPTTAEARLKENYTGKATDAEGYIHESIVEPSVHIAGDKTEYKNPDGTSLMPDGLAATMTPQDLADLIAYLMTLK
jgi:cytochrome c2